MQLTTMSYEVRDRVAHVRLIRPEIANVINPESARDLREVMIAIEFDDSVKAVCFTAEGGVFCGGGDLNLFHESGSELPSVAANLVIDLHAAISKMNQIPKPFVAGVRGAAGGAGMSLVSAFDLVVSSETAKYTMAYTKAGVTPDGTSSYFISRHIGVRRMMDLTLTNRVLSAIEAEAWGLVNRLVPDDEVDAAAAVLAQQLADGPSRALGQAKRVVYYGADHALLEAGEFEARTITQVMTGHDAKEGIAAFVERRPPNFTGE